MKRAAWIALVLPLGGCVIPFVHSHREKPQTPAAVQRFSSQAEALGLAPAGPALSEVTGSMSAAIEALPEVTGGDRLARDVARQAEAMTERPDETDALARASLDAALEAVRRAKPAVRQGDQSHAVEAARQAIEKIAPGDRSTVELAYREVARAMVLVTGGGAGAAQGGELPELVARFAVEEPEEARRTGAQAIAAMAEALVRRPLPPEHADRTARDLRKRAERLAGAPPLEYAGELKDALALVARSLDRSAASPAERRALAQAKVAVETIRDDRPMQLQHAAVAAALRLVTEALTAGVTSP
jgi:hypothetical protein